MGGTGGPSGTGQAGGTGTGGAQASSRWPGVDQSQFQALKNIGGNLNGMPQMPNSGGPSANVPQGGNQPSLSDVGTLPAGIRPGGGPGSTTGPNNSLVGGAINTPYWQQQYQQNPSGVQGMFSPPAANQLSQFYPGQQIFPNASGASGGAGGYGGGGSGAHGGPSGGGTAQGGKGANPGGPVQGAGGLAPGMMPKQIVGSLGGGAQA